MLKRNDQKGFAHILLLVAFSVILVGGIGTRIYTSKRHQVDPKTLSAAVEGTTQLRIDSDPAGINVTGKTQCDSSKLSKTTPYTCIAPNQSIDTVLTVPNVVTLNGQSYQFKTWDGCSESNADKKICRVRVNSGKLKTVKASYGKAAVASQTSASKATTSSTSNSQKSFNCSNSDNGGYATCTLSGVSAPTKFIVPIDVTASCDTRIYASSGSGYTSYPCDPKPTPEQISSLQPNIQLTCSVAGACRQDHSIAAFYDSYVVSKLTDISLKIPLKSTVKFGYCGHVTCHGNAAFASWEAGYDVASGSYISTGHYSLVSSSPANQ